MARAAFGKWSAATAYNRGQVYWVAELLEGRAEQFAECCVNAEGLSAAAARRAVAAAIDLVGLVCGLAGQDRADRRRRHQEGAEGAPRPDGGPPRDRDYASSSSPRGRCRLETLPATSGAPPLASTAAKSAATSLGSAALHWWIAAPVSFARAASCRFDALQQRARSSLRENNRASEVLRPGPVPTIKRRAICSRLFQRACPHCLRIPRCSTRSA